MSIRVFDTINPSAIMMQSTMVWNMLSARAMLVPFGALYVLGRERTCQCYHPALARPIACAVGQQRIHFSGKMNGVLAEMVLLQPCECCLLLSEHASCRGCSPPNDAPDPQAEAMRYPATPDSSPRPSGCLRKWRKHSEGQQNANARLSKPVAAKFRFSISKNAVQSYSFSWHIRPKRWFRLQI